MTLAYVQSYVGSRTTGATYFRRAGDNEIIAWEDAIAGTPGWWWSVSRGDIVLKIGWTAGKRRDRDAEIAGALAALQTLEAA